MHYIKAIISSNISPYAYSFGLGKRADDVDEQYDDNTDYYPDPSNMLNLNMENWENGGNNENKNDIDVIDYDLLRAGKQFWNYLRYIILL